MPGIRDLAIFVPTTTMTDRQTDCFTPCACAWGNNGQLMLQDKDPDARKEYRCITSVCVAMNHDKELLRVSPE